MICYTNHALDQFLELIISQCSLYKGIVRVGSRSKSERMDKFLLKNLKKNSYFGLINLKDEEAQLKSMSSTIRFKINQLKLAETNGILSLSFLCEYMSESQFSELLEYASSSNMSIDLALVDWLGFFHLDEQKSKNEKYEQNNQIANFFKISQQNQIRQHDNGEDDENDNREAIFDEISKANNERILDDESDDDNDEYYDARSNDNQEQTQEPILSKKEFAENSYKKSLIISAEIARIIDNYKSSLTNSARFYDEDYDEERALEANRKIDQTLIKHIQSHISFILSTADELEHDSKAEKRRLWNLAPIDRYKVYNEWLCKFREDEQRQIETLREQYNECAERCKELRMQVDRHIMQNAYIVAMTTTGSARYHKIINDIGPKIVIVEEAAEVFESHIVSSLSKSCQHLILIGDHVQLRPNPNVYQLARQYKLDVSLFERLLNNNIKKQMLTCQHRMQPEISCIMKFFYENPIIDHPSVLNYPKIIRGLKNTVYFIKHDIMEKAPIEDTSKSNLFEADYLAALADYLHKNKYEQNRISILTMYLGQMGEIKSRLMKKDLSDVKVCTVDNYQGEENDIILLSLVRSNKNESIGFLNIENRVCVSLSRAKHALYCIGNFELIRRNSKKWQEIIDHMEAKQLVGDGLWLTCGQHPQNDTVAKCDLDFLKRPDGGCHLPCNFRLDCGHQCKLKCHTFTHDQYKCKNLCDKRLTGCEHLCEKRCGHSSKCEPCLKLVTKTIADCGHQITSECYRTPEKKDCLQKCERVLESCGHKCEKECASPCEPCKKRVTKTIVECGHQVQQECHLMPSKNDCKLNCERTLTCGHKCKKKCGADCEPCMHRMEKKIEECGHSITIACSIVPSRKLCSHRCQKLLECGHECKKMCNKLKCEPCTTRVTKVIGECGHEVNIQCGVTPQRSDCREKCQRTMSKCGHKCELACREECGQCSQQVEKEATCKHKESKIKVNCCDEVWTYQEKCQLRCLTPLVCGHLCKSKCSDCFGGYIHQPCKEICERYNCCFA
jgi:hypothetical protein